MADDLLLVHKTREELRRTITGCTTSIQEQEHNVREFQSVALTRSTSLAAAMKEAELALEQLKGDHERAAADARKSSVEQRRLASRADSLEAQRAATAALKAEVDTLKAHPAGRAPAKSASTHDDSPQVRRCDSTPSLGCYVGC